MSSIKYFQVIVILINVSLVSLRTKPDFHQIILLLTRLGLLPPNSLDGLIKLVCNTGMDTPNTEEMVFTNS